VVKGFLGNALGGLEGMKHWLEEFGMYLYHPILSQLLGGDGV
jgi:hypothetical protein